MSPDPAAGGRWLITLADLVAILVAFFVLLYSMSSMQATAWTTVAQSLSQRLNPSRVWRGPEAPSGRTVARTEVPEGADLGYLATLIGEKIRDRPILGRARLARRPDRLVLMLPADLLFAEGGAALTPAARASVAALADVLGGLGNRIDVVGHADPRPVHGHFTSNWVLSLTRAVAVADALADAGAEGAIVARGRGASSFGALPAGLPKAQRYRLARRVDVVLRAAGGEGVPF